MIFLSRVHSLCMETFLRNNESSHWRASGTAPSRSWWPPMWLHEALISQKLIWLYSVLLQRLENLIFWPTLLLFIKVRLNLWECNFCHTKVSFAFRMLSHIFTALGELAELEEQASAFVFISAKKKTNCDMSSRRLWVSNNSVCTLSVPK